MKIAILEAKTVSKGDVSFEEIYRLGEVSEFPLTPAEDIVKNIGDAEAALCNKTVFDEKVLRACPNLKYIGLCATGDYCMQCSCVFHGGCGTAGIFLYFTFCQ